MSFYKCLKISLINFLNLPKKGAKRNFLNLPKKGAKRLFRLGSQIIIKIQLHESPVE